MCLIILRWQPDSPTPLTLLSNRDEFYARPSRPAHFWEDHPDIFGGRDLEKGGTWLAISKQGRLACVTNYREPGRESSGLRSRGEIPARFLTAQKNALEYAEQLQEIHHELPGFNALFFDGKELVYASNRSDSEPVCLPAGDYGVSNHILDTPWPKLLRAKERFVGELHVSPSPSTERSCRLLELMRDNQAAPEQKLPDTGVGLEVEKMLSPIFIRSPAYGTRTSTLVEVRKNRTFRFSEQNYKHGEIVGDISHYEIEFAQQV